jgi:hypothetical protein
MWRRDVVRFGKGYIHQYLRHMPPSEPFDQWDDRNQLYSIRYDLAHGIALPGTAQTQREMYVQSMSGFIGIHMCANQMSPSIYDNMRYLNESTLSKITRFRAEHPVQGVNNGADFYSDAGLMYVHADAYA